MAQSSQPQWPTLSQEGGHQSGVYPRSAAVAAVAAVIKNLAQGGCHGGIRTIEGVLWRAPTLPVPSVWGELAIYSGEAVLPTLHGHVLFNKWHLCGVFWEDCEHKNSHIPTPLRWHLPSPVYLKWLGGDDRGACSLAAAGRLPPPTPRPLWA